VSEPVNHLLFVDDDRHVLDGLMRLLRRRRGWKLTFAASGEAALQVLAEQPIDVVVTDMRMPGMDGAELLTLVQAQYPHVARVVLSGHTEDDAAIRSLTVAHQFLAKPCDTGMLTATLERLTAVPTADRARRVRVAGVRVLPTPAASHDALMALLHAAAPSAEPIARVVERDVALSARLLHAVSSPFFGHSGRYPSIGDAVVKLGTTLLRELARCGALCRRVDGSEATRLERANARAVGLGAAAAERVPERRADAYAAGLLHDIGPWVDDDASAGRELLSLWGLPELIVDAEVAGASASDLAVRAAVVAAAAAAPHAIDAAAADAARVAS
jgi:DNA-binding NarL/FixJ family response regulator